MNRAEYLERRTMEELELACMQAGVELQTLINEINALPDCDEARELADDLEYARQAARNNVERGNTQNLMPLLIDVRRRLTKLTAPKEAIQNWQSKAGKGNTGRSKAPELWKRGFIAVLEEFPEVTASELRGILDGMPRTYDDHNVEISLECDDDSIKVLDLISGDEQHVEKSNQRTYLSRTRNS